MQPLSSLLGASTPDSSCSCCPHRILQWVLCMGAHLLWTKLLYSRWANKNLHICTHKCILMCKGMFKFWALLVPDINPGSVRWQQWSWWWAPGKSESVLRCLWTISLPPVFLTTWKDVFLYGINTAPCRAKCYTKIAFPLLYNFKKKFLVAFLFSTTWLYDSLNFSQTLLSMRTRDSSPATLHNHCPESALFPTMNPCFSGHSVFLILLSLEHTLT